MTSNEFDQLRQRALFAAAAEHYKLIDEYGAELDQGRIDNTFDVAEKLEDMGHALAVATPRQNNRLGTLGARAQVHTSAGKRLKQRILDAASR